MNNVLCELIVMIQKERCNSDTYARAQKHVESYVHRKDCNLDY